MIGARPCINALEEIRSILSSDDAARCVRLHGVSFDAIWPQELLRASSDEKIRNFVRHRLPDAGP